MVNQVFEYPQIDQARRELFQGEIPFYRWVEARLGEELEVRQDSLGMFFMGFAGSLTDEKLDAASRKKQKRF